MSAVNLWKAQELQPHNSVTDSLSKWRFVGIAEISDLAEKFPVNLIIWSTPINRFSALFSYFLHKYNEHLIVAGNSKEPGGMA